MRKIFLYGAITIAVISGLFFGVLPLYAQTTQPEVCKNPTSEDIRQACADYAVETAKLKELQSQLNAQKQKSGSLQQNVNALISQITATQTKIKDKITAISVLSTQIGQKTKAITELGSELNREHESMRQLIKKTNEIDQKGATYVLFSADSVSDFYKDLDDFLSIKESLYASLDKVKHIKAATETQKADLVDKQYQAVDAKAALEDQKKQIQANQAQVQKLLASSKDEEKKVQAVVADQQKKVADIESKLFSFAGGATKAIPFSEAYQYALAASSSTGVRPAFVLAILKQESNLGANVGTCNRAGDPPSKSYKNVMSPTRDQPAFLRITSALGLNPDITPVSCPYGGGFGGAMGPAQFIPSTWESIQGRVSSALGVATANPWRARDAIYASSLYLADRGAKGGVEANERNAACRYYSGRSCDGKKPYNSFYGNSVMALTRSIQADIDYLTTYGVARH